MIQLRAADYEAKYLRSIGYKEIEGFPKYFINKDGSVVDTFTGSSRELTQYVDPDGIHLVTLIGENGFPDNLEVAFLVCKYFIRNPHEFTKYRHLDGNLDNNTASNLVWDQVGDEDKYISKSRVKAKIKPRKKQIEGHGGIRVRRKVYCLETDTVYSSAGAAAIDLMLNQSGLSAILRMGKDRYCGYHVCYAEEKDTHTWNPTYVLKVINTSTYEVKEFSSINRAVNELGINRRTIVRHIESGESFNGMVFDITEE